MPVTVDWHQIVTSGGGLVSLLDVHADGTVVVGTDAGGGYLRNNTTAKWDQFITYARMPIPELGGYRQQNGLTAITIAPSNSSRFYCLHRHYNLGPDTTFLYRSDNRGSNWVEKPFSNDSAVLSPNDETYKRLQRKIAVDPANADVVYVTNPGAAPRRSNDGGATFEDIPDIPTGTGAGAVCMTFDPSSGTTGGKTNIVYIPIWGAGVWRSTDAGANFSEISSTIVTPTSSAVVDASSHFYIAHEIGGTYYISKYNGTSWSDVRSNVGGSRYVIAAHPTTGGKIASMRSLSVIFDVTTDGGTNWTSYTKANQDFLDGDAPWQNDDVEVVGPSVSAMMFDPSSSGGNDLWLCMWQGVWKTTLGGTAPTWTANCLGIEELVINDINHEIGGDLLIGTWDEIGFKRPTTTLQTAPSTHLYFPTILPIQHGWIFARDPQDLNFCVMVASTASACGYSTNGGTTWTAFATVPSGGVFTASSICVNDGVIIWTMAGSSNNFPWRSTDNGTTWVKIEPATVPTSGEIGWQNSFNFPKKMTAADRVNPLKFYMSNYLVGPRGVWRSSDAGVTWTKGTQPYSNTSFAIQEMRAVPGYEDHLFATNGHVTSTSQPITGTPFAKSTDGGATWTNITNVLGVVRFGFGKALSTYPTVFFAGFVSGVYGIWRMTDGDEGTITQLLAADGDPWPLGINDTLSVLEGDKDIFGRVYVGFEGNGSAFAPGPTIVDRWGRL